MDTPSILPILQKIPLFADLTEAEHQEIIKNITLQYYPAGYVFFKQGDLANPSSALFIIKHGMVKISRNENAQAGASFDESSSDKEVAVLSDNNFFGEMALVTNDGRNASATAISECEVFQLTKDDFDKLIQSSPVMANKISTEFVQRVKKNNLPNQPL